MTQTHTPGPWRNENGSIQSQGKWSDETGDHFDWKYPRILAHVTDDWDETANARLIAAAPDMLAALQRVLPIYEAYVPYRADGMNEDDRENFEAIEAIRAAIARATS